MSYRFRRGQKTTAPLALLVWSHPATDAKARERRFQVFNLLLEGFPWINIFFLDNDEINLHLSHNVGVWKKAGYLRRKFGQNAFTSVFYAHDISADFIAQSAMQAFPSATRVCFGDALGLVYSNDYFTDQTYPIDASKALFRPLQTIYNLMVRIKRAWTLPRRRRRLDAEYAVLILPCDPGGDFLIKKRLLPVDNDSLCYVLNGLSNSAERNLINLKYWDCEDEKSSVVMLLGAYSESRLTTVSKECAMYVEAARLHIKPGTKILLKAHPSARPEKSDFIQQALAVYYEKVVCINDEFPIEIIPSVAKHYKILSFSYSSVSLVYLYGSSVLHAMTNALINMYFPEESRLWMLESNELYLQQIIVARHLRSKQSEALVCQE